MVGYSHSFDIPVYASDEWNNSDLSKQVSAFKAYCKSRNITIDGSVADGVTSFTSQTYQSICNFLGINIDALQSEIKYKTDGNLGLKWFFTSSGLSAYNRIFSEFLQNNNLEVGDIVEDLLLYSGEYYTDEDGYTCLVFIVDNINNVGSDFVYPNHLMYKGTSLKYTSEQLTKLTPDENSRTYASFNFSSTLYYQREILQTNYFDPTNNAIYDGSLSINIPIWSHSLGYTGFYSVVRANNDNRYKFCFFSHGVKYRNNWTSDRYRITLLNTTDAPFVPNTNIQNININLTTNNNTITVEKTINEGDSYIINNNGQEITNVPSDPPSYNPYPDGGGTTGGSTSSGGSDGTINFPNFNFDIPSINWSLGDLSSKFPFSIPFDLVAFYTVLNADPIAPSIDRTIPLGFTDWHFKADFSQFENYAVIIRNVEYIGFVVTLIFITIKFVKG